MQIECLIKNIESLSMIDASDRVWSKAKKHWPLFGSLGVDKAFVISALFGRGIMSTCAARRLCTKWVLKSDLAEFAAALCIQRFEDAIL